MLPVATDARHRWVAGMVTCLYWVLGHQSGCLGAFQRVGLARWGPCLIPCFIYRGPRRRLANATAGRYIGADAGQHGHRCRYIRLAGPLPCRLCVLRRPASRRRHDDGAVEEADWPVISTPHYSFPYRPVCELHSVFVR